MTTGRDRHATADEGFPSMPPATFAKLRELVGTQEETAMEMQTARRTIGRWERGDRAVPGAAAVCIRLLAEKALARKKFTAKVAREMIEQAAETAAEA